MALIVIILIMLIGMGVVGSLLGSITPFVTKLGTISQYNVAYYGAVMGAERGLSALRYHDAGFQGSGSLTAGNASDKVRFSAATFGKFTSDIKTQAGWTISSRVNSIPSIGNGNVESLYAGVGSEDFNALEFGETINFPLYFDDTTSADYYYTTPQTSDMKNLLLGASPVLPNIQGNIRVPEKIYGALGSNDLSDNLSADPNADIDNDSIADDIIVSWGLQGNDVLNGTPFSILPSIKQNFAYAGGGDPVPYYEYDNGIRESIINSYYTAGAENINTVSASSAGFNIIHNASLSSSFITGHNILPVNASFASVPFDQLFATSTAELTGLTLSLGIINRIQTNVGDYIPFLEYNMRLCGDAACTTILPLPDPYYTLQGYARVGDYRATVDIRKPVKESTSASTFVTIF